MMPPPDLEQLADSVVLTVKTAVKGALSGVLARLAVLESRGTARDGIDGVAGIKGDPGEKGDCGQTGLQGELGPAGKDADPTLVLALKDEIVAVQSELLQTKSMHVTPAMVTQMVVDAMAALPTPQDGKDGTSVDTIVVESLVATKVAQAVAAIPVPKDGHSVAIDDVVPMIQTLIEKAFAAVPPPTDGLGIKSAVVDRVGHLIFTMTNGAEKDVGSIVGQNGQDGRDGIPGIGRPGADGKDGADGLSFDDINEELQDGGRVLIRRYCRGERVKEFRHQTASIVYRGVYVDGKTYAPGDTATSGGALWHCNEPTHAKPGDGSKAWTLCVKRGSDGRDLREGMSLPAFPVVKVGKR